MSVYKELFEGKSILRALFNERIRKERIVGRTLDLGGGRKASYRPFLNVDGEIICADMDPKAEPDVVADLEKPFPFKKNAFQNVLAFHLLEHVYEFQHIASESYRVVKKGGKFYSSTPFLYRKHSHPHDFFRYTDDALKMMLGRAGFKKVTTIPLGFGPLTASLAMIQTHRYLVPTPIAPLAFWFSSHADRILSARTRYSNAENYALGFFTIAEK